MTTPRFLLTSSFVMMLCWPAGGSVAAKSPVFPGNCGARCLYVIALSRGCQLPTYDQFVEQHDWAAAPSCSLHQIHVSAKELGLEGTLLKFEGAPPDLKHRLLVAHTTDEHFVILQKVDEEMGVRWIDPPKASRQGFSRDFERLDGYAIGFEPMEVDPIRWPYYVLTVAGLLIFGWLWTHRGGSGWRNASWSVLLGLAVIGCDSAPPPSDAPGAHVISQNTEVSTTRHLEAMKVPSGFQFEQPTYDLGELELHDEPLIHSLCLIRGGSFSDTAVSSVRSSCGCTVAKLDGRAGQPACVMLQIDRDSPGEQIVTVTAHLEDNLAIASTEVRFTIKPDLAIHIEPGTYDPVVEDEPLQYNVRLVGTDLLDQADHPDGSLTLHPRMTETQRTGGVLVQTSWVDLRNAVVQVTPGRVSGTQSIQFVVLDDQQVQLGRPSSLHWNRVRALTVHPQAIYASPSTPTIKLIVEGRFNDDVKIDLTIENSPVPVGTMQMMSPGLCRVEIAYADLSEIAAGVANVMLRVAVDAEAAQVPLYFNL